MKAIYPAKQRVSIWVGNFQTEDDFEKCIDTDVTSALNLPTHMQSICEIHFDKKPVSIRQLIAGFSGSHTFIKEVEDKAAALGNPSANSALVCYYLACEDAPEQWGSLYFLGSFVGHDHSN